MAPVSSLALEAELAKAAKREDDGTGVFGDLKRLDKKWRKYNNLVTARDRKRAAGLFGKVDLSDLVSETASEVARETAAIREKKYLKDRIALQMSLEEVSEARPADATRRGQ